LHDCGDETSTLQRLSPLFCLDFELDSRQVEIAAEVVEVFSAYTLISSNLSDQVDFIIEADSVGCKAEDLEQGPQRRLLSIVSHYLLFFCQCCCYSR